MTRHHRSSAWQLPEDGIVDAIAVEIAARGQRPVRLTPTERRLAAARILAAGGNPNHVARRLHMSYRAAAALCTDLTRTDDTEGNVA